MFFFVEKETLIKICDRAMKLNSFGNFVPLYFSLSAVIRIKERKHKFSFEQKSFEICFKKFKCVKNFSAKDLLVA